MAESVKADIARSIGIEAAIAVAICNDDIVRDVAQVIDGASNERILGARGNTTPDGEAYHSIGGPGYSGANGRPDKGIPEGVRHGIPNGRAYKCIIGARRERLAGAVSDQNVESARVQGCAELRADCRVIKARGQKRAVVISDQGVIVARIDLISAGLPQKRVVEASG